MLRVDNWLKKVLNVLVNHNTEIFSLFTFY